MVAPLNLPVVSRVRLFRAMEALVRRDPTFGRIVKPSSFRTWSGNPEDAKEFTIEHAPCLRWTPTAGPEVFKTPDSMVGSLFINCEILIRGTNADDIANFWGMVERVFYPGQPATNAIQQTLVNAVAYRACLLHRASIRPGPGRCFHGRGGSDQDRLPEQHHADLVISSEWPVVSGQ